ncbi:DUF624 domain-containing protein [Clostridiaceae bacterium OttesenSCG-928-D20]|nr:DUF624 domain-containing protein [Clostridiaceae bacterium OttesenSCG-928-D20]
MSNNKYLNGFFRFMSLVADLIIWNLLFIVCSLPIITIGASYTALYTMVDKLMRKKDYNTLDFFKEFKLNFKKATIVWLITLLFLVVFIINYWLIYNLEFKYNWVILIGFIILAVVFLITISWSFPLLSQFENSLKNTITNSFLFGIGRFPQSIIMVLTHILPIYMFIAQIYWFYQLSFVLLAIWYSINCMICFAMTDKAFKPYRPAVTDELEDEYDNQNA